MKIIQRITISIVVKAWRNYVNLWGMNNTAAGNSRTCTSAILGEIIICKTEVIWKLVNIYTSSNNRVRSDQCKFIAIKCKFSEPIFISNKVAHISVMMRESTRGSVSDL